MSKRMQGQKTKDEQKWIETKQKEEDTLIVTKSLCKEKDTLKSWLSSSSSKINSKSSLEIFGNVLHTW